MAMRSTLVAALAIAVGLALVASSGASASRAHAQEADASIFYGFISPGDGGATPLKVRAIVSDVTCGTDDVTSLAGGLGFYIVTVSSASAKAGCGTEGAPVSFLFLAGEVDDGALAAQTQAWMPGTQRLDLSPVPDATFGTFVGELPPGPGFGVMRWTGASATPIEQALTSIPRDVESITYFDVPTQSYRVYVPGAPDYVSRYLLVDSDDIVFVRVR